MKFRLCAVLAFALLAGCTGVDYSRGFVRDVQLEPRDPAPGQRVRMFVQLHDPYLYPGVEGAGPCVTLAADAGEVEGLAWNDSAREWELIRGGTVVVAPSTGMFWTLPSEPGEYKLTVTFDGHSLTRRVVAR